MIYDVQEPTQKYFRNLSLVKEEKKGKKNKNKKNNLLVEDLIPILLSVPSILASHPRTVRDSWDEFCLKNRRT